MELHYIDRTLFQRMFGVAVREARESFHLTLEQVEAQTGIPLARLDRIENGRVWIRSKTRSDLVQALKISEERIDKMVSVARLGFIDLFHSAFADLSAEDTNL